MRIDRCYAGFFAHSIEFPGKGDNMATSYLFKTNKGRFIVNDERSKLGYSYPRIFVESNKGYVNIDTTIGACFPQSKSDFESWIDGEEVTGADLGKICENLSLNKDALLRMVDQFQTMNA